MHIEIRRKLIHMSSLWIPLALFFMSKNHALYLFITATILVLAFDFTRYLPLNIPFVSYIENNFLRKRELSGFRLSGASWMLIAATTTSILFDVSVAFAGMLVLIISDSAAALIGTKWGSINLFGKSLQGSLAFFVSSWLCIVLTSWLFGLSNWYFVAILASLVAMLVELFAVHLRVDDNFSIPLAVCLSIHLLLLV